MRRASEKDIRIGSMSVNSFWYNPVRKSQFPAIPSSEISKIKANNRNQFHRERPAAHFASLLRLPDRFHALFGPRLRACVESLGKIVVKVARVFKSNRQTEEISGRRRPFALDARAMLDEAFHPAERRGALPQTCAGGDGDGCGFPARDSDRKHPAKAALSSDGALFRAR
jgi:hypothetical protein